MKVDRSIFRPGSRYGGGGKSGGGWPPSRRAGVYIYTVLHVVEGGGKKSRQCHESNANSPFLSLAMYEKACSVCDGEEGGRLIGAGDDLHTWNGQRRPAKEEGTKKVLR